MIKKLSKTSIVTVSFIVAAIILGMLIFTVGSIEKQMTVYCFNTLDESTDHLAEELNDMFLRDRVFLGAEAVLLASLDGFDEANVVEVMSAFDSKSSYISRFELLTADDRLIRADGVIVENTELRFAAEKKKGAYISEMTKDVYNGEAIIKNAVPVIKGTETVAVLYGIISLEEFSQKYRADVYGGKAAVYIEDGDNGDFLLDTYHSTLGNMYDLGDRQTLPGYSFDRATADMKNGVSGSIAFISETTGKAMYLYYEPLHLNNWNVMLSVTEEVAFTELRGIRSYLYRMIAVDGIVMAIYFTLLSIYFWGVNRKIKKAGNEDPTTGLQNRNAYNAQIHKAKADAIATVVFIDVNGLHEVNNSFGHEAGDRLLSVVAAELKNFFPDKEIYRIGGDEFLILAETATIDICNEKMQIVAERLNAYGYSISYGIVEAVQGQQIEAAVKAADKKMLENKRDYYMKNDRRCR